MFDKHRFADDESDGLIVTLMTRKNLMEEIDNATFDDFV